jgi:hypothetical protein
LRRALLFRELLPTDWDPRVPETLHGGSELTWNFYARRRTATVAPLGPDAPPVNYVLQDTREPAPAGMRVLGASEHGVLYLRDEGIWAAHRTSRPAASEGSRLYAIPRGMLFRSIPPPADGPTIISVVDVLDDLGVDTRALLSWLGVN